MRCNTSRMNSWHSFSPNGRWLVFSSKARSPYTQMYLTHIDEQGNDSPAILIDNSTAANRAVNLPEFVNIPRDGMLAIATPAVDMYKKFEHAAELGNKGQFDEAITEWKELAAANADDARIHNNLGAALGQKGRYAEAIPEFEKALELDPQYFTTYTNLGRAQLASGQPVDAIATFQKGLHYNSDSADLHKYLGLALSKQGRIEEAQAEFAKALEINPRDADTHNNLGTVLSLERQYPEAIAHFAQALELEPQHHAVYENMGLAQLAAGRPDDAILSFQKGLEDNPGSADLHTHLGVALARKGRGDEAQAEFAKALEIDPNDADAHRNLGRALVLAGRLDQGIPHLERAVAIDPRFAEAHADLGRALVVQGHYDQATPHLEKALEIRPDLVEAQYFLGESLYYSQARVREAARPLDQGAAPRPEFRPRHERLRARLGLEPRRFRPQRRRGGETRHAGGGTFRRAESRLPRYAGGGLRRGGKISRGGLNRAPGLGPCRPTASRSGSGGPYPPGQVVRVAATLPRPPQGHSIGKQCRPIARCSDGGSGACSSKGKPAVTTPVTVATRWSVSLDRIVCLAQQLLTLGVFGGMRLLVGGEGRRGLLLFPQPGVSVGELKIGFGKLGLKGHGLFEFARGGGVVMLAHQETPELIMCQRIRRIQLDALFNLLAGLIVLSRGLLVGDQKHPHKAVVVGVAGFELQGAPQVFIRRVQLGLRILIQGQEKERPGIVRPQFQRALHESGAGLEIVGGEITDGDAVGNVRRIRGQPLRLLQ